MWLAKNPTEKLWPPAEKCGYCGTSEKSKSMQHEKSKFQHVINHR